MIWFIALPTYSSLIAAGAGGNWLRHRSRTALLYSIVWMYVGYCTVYVLHSRGVCTAFVPNNISCSKRVMASVFTMGAMFTRIIKETCTRCWFVVCFSSKADAYLSYWQNVGRSTQTEPGTRGFMFHGRIQNKSPSEKARSFTTEVRTLSPALDIHRLSITLWWPA